MENILIFGASDHSKYTIEIVEKEKKYRIVGIMDMKLKKDSYFEGYTVLGYLDDLVEVIKSYEIVGGIIAIGDNFTRKKLSEQIIDNKKDFKFVNAIHPSVIIGKNVKIGEGCVLMAGVIVNNDSLLGNHCFLATRASLDHDSQMGDFSSLSPGVVTGGRVRIGRATAIGLSASILHYRTIGDNSIIGSASLVTKDVGNNVVAYGIPAKVIRKRNESDSYL